MIMGGLQMSNENDKTKLLEGEKEILLDHDYDGIKELNHPLPSWWVAVFVLTIIFSIPYFIYYTFMGGTSIEQNYNAEMAEVVQKQQSHKSTQKGFDLEAYNAYIVTPEAQKLGRKIYKRKCKACHGVQGEGGIGPNLTDNYWLHGNGDVESTHKTIQEGVLDKGMPAWGDTLSSDELIAVVGYIQEFKGTNPANAKEPQGSKVE